MIFFFMHFWCTFTKVSTSQCRCVSPCDVTNRAVPFCRANPKDSSESWGGEFCLKGVGTCRNFLLKIHIVLDCGSHWTWRKMKAADDFINLAHQFWSGVTWTDPRPLMHIACMDFMPKQLSHWVGWNLWVQNVQQKLIGKTLWGCGARKCQHVFHLKLPAGRSPLWSGLLQFALRHEDKGKVVYAAERVRMVRAQLCFYPHDGFALQLFSLVSRGGVGGVAMRTSIASACQALPVCIAGCKLPYHLQSRRLGVANLWGIIGNSFWDEGSQRCRTCIRPVPSGIHLM